jgi:Ca-activated chloride channel family protein
MTERLLTFGFGEPWWLLLLLLLPVLAYLQAKTGNRVPSLTYSAVGILKNIGVGVKSRCGSWWINLELIALALLIVALAGPRIESGASPDRREGVDIVLAVDVSQSMDTKDFSSKNGKISRRDALIEAIADFVDHRPNDRFGMIGFAGNTYLMSPMTLDANWIKNVLKAIETKFGTAIGDGILRSIRLLQDSAKGKSKIIIVVTDGENNAGTAPLMAAEEAAKAGIRVHTIVITDSISGGDTGGSLMAKVAEKTGGMYFRATNLDTMIDVYRQIDRMEKTPFEQQKYRVYDELYPWPAVAGLILLVIALTARNTFGMRLP